MNEVLKIIGLLVFSVLFAIGAGVMAYLLIKVPVLAIGLASVGGFLTPVTWYVRRLWNE